MPKYRRKFKNADGYRKDFREWKKERRRQQRLWKDAFKYLDDLSKAGVKIPHYK